MANKKSNSNIFYLKKYLIVRLLLVKSHADQSSSLRSADEWNRENTK